MNRKVLYSFGLLLLLVTVMVSFFGIVKPTPISRTNSETSGQGVAIKVAVVNEDTGTVYNGQQVNIATTLVHSFITKNHYAVEVVSQSIAESGLKNDTYQLMIIFPSKFSEEALALESTSPTRANFQYQILSEKQLTVKQAEQAVVDFKELFNKDLITIYFTSIIGNLRTAQYQVADVVANEQESLATFTNRLSSPLLQYAQQFTGISSAPSGLLSTYSDFNKDLLNSNEAFNSIISVDKTYEGTIEQIKSQQDTWKHSLENREKHLSAFDEAFSALSVEEQLAKLSEINTYISTHLAEPAVWDETNKAVEAYNQDIQTLLERLKALNIEIDTTLSNYDTKIKEAVASSLKENAAVVNGANQTLGSYIKSLNDSMTSQIANKWPTFYYDDATIDSLSLSALDKQHLKNVNAFMHWYSQQTEKSLPIHKMMTVENEELSALKTDIKSKIESPRSMVLPAFEGRLERFILTVPTGYTLNVSAYSVTDLGGGKYQVHLPENVPAGTVIAYLLGVQDEASLSIFSPILVEGTVDTTENVAVMKETSPYEAKTEESETSSLSTSIVAPTTTETGASDGEKLAQSIVKETVTMTKTITITKTNQTDIKVIKRQYALQDKMSDWAYDPLTISKAIYTDVNSYLQLSGIVSAYYGLDLTQGGYAPSTIVPADGSVATWANSNDLQSIVTSLIKATTVEALKSDLKCSDEELTNIENRLANVANLTANIAGLRTTTNDLISQLTQLIEQTSTVDKTIKDKPVFTETEKVENTDMVTVSMDMNRDLAELMAASQTLMLNTRSNQALSEIIEGSIKQLTSDVKRLEKDGESLSGRVAELQQVMASEYGSNEEFLRNFSTVLSNTRTGNTKNEAVYDYLSNPVDAAKIGNVVSAVTATQPQATRQDERSGLLIILMTYLVSLVSAYLMQHANKEELQKRMDVTERLSWKNATGPMVFLSVLATVAGWMIAMISGVKLGFSMAQMGSFVVLLILISLTMTYSVNLLMDKLKSLGFLLSVGALLLYIVSATQLFDTYYVNPTQFLAKLSPLTYLEEVVKNVINQQGNTMLATVMLLSVATVLGVETVFLYRQIEGRK